MPMSRSRSRVAQLQLFNPPQGRPSWQGLPPAIQQTTVRLLAQLLRQHGRRRVLLSQGKEARNE